MSKRKEPRDSSPSSIDDPTETVSADFEFFDAADIDFHGLKTLLKQLFDIDHDDKLNSDLANLIITQPTLGTVIKVSDEVTPDAQQNDPFAFLSLIPLQHHATTPAIQTLTAYLRTAALTIPSLATTLPPLLAPTASLGLLLGERLINLPPELPVALLRTLHAELADALPAAPALRCSHYLILSKVYTELVSALPAPARERERKKAKHAGVAGATTGETFYFHVEDEVLQRFAVGWGSFEYVREREAGASDAKRAFQEAGIATRGHLILVEAGRLQEALDAVEAFVGGQ